jgi:Cu-Zn family superoxide dismutase
MMEGAMLRLTVLMLLAGVSSAAVAQEWRVGAELVAAGGKPAGLVALMDTPHGVLLQVTIEPGALAAGQHAMHIHATGNCSDADAGFEKAGGHYNPREGEHGFIPEAGPHAGDMPNIVVVDGQKSEVTAFNAMVRFTEGDAPLFDDDGSALVIHAGTDDYQSQPAGNAGDRIACAALTDN